MCWLDIRSTEKQTVWSGVELWHAVIPRQRSCQAIRNQDLPLSLSLTPSRWCLSIWHLKALKCWEWRVIKQVYRCFVWAEGWEWNYQIHSLARNTRANAPYGQKIWIGVLASPLTSCYLLNGEVLCNDGIFPHGIRELNRAWIIGSARWVLSILTTPNQCRPT